MVSIDDLVPELALSAAQRRDLVAIGNFCTKHPGAVGLTAYTGRILERKGYVEESAPPTRVLGARFRLTKLGGLRYRAELSHREHCNGCALCRDLNRARRRR